MNKKSTENAPNTIVSVTNSLLKLLSGHVLSEEYMLPIIVARYEKQLTDT